MVCGCARCGRVLLYAPPMLRTLRALPPYADLRKQNYMRIKMLPLSKKRKKVNDELSMLLEPLTYDNVVEKYGIEITMVEPCDKNTSINTMKEQWSERFPLADVTAMAFCPSEAHHNRAAVSIHSGFIVLIAM